MSGTQQPEVKPNIVKITEGYVAQTFDANTGELIHQEFKAGDHTSFQYEDGTAASIASLWQMPTLPHAEYSMLTPEHAEEIEELKAMIGHLIWLVEVQLKEDGGHIVRDAKELIQTQAATLPSADTKQ